MAACASAQQSDIAQALRPELQNKNLVLRGFYRGKELLYRSDGSLEIKAKQGFWASDGLVHITNVSMDKYGALVLTGQRIISVFDHKTQCFGNAITKLPIEIHIELDPAWNDAAPVRTLLNQIFGFGIGTLQAYVPSYWRRWLTGTPAAMPNGEWHFVNAAPAESAATKEPTVNRVGAGKDGKPVSPPRAVAAPDPEYTTAAKKARLQGTTILWLTVTPDGKASDILIQRPIGGGLDDQAVAAVQQWRFQPAMKVGHPVAVQINVEVNFRLY